MPRKEKTGIAFAYIGDEQLSWGRQAFQCPKHYYVMPAILYLASSIEAHLEQGLFSTPSCHYLNRTTQDIASMVSVVAGDKPSIVGLSCYSWNIEDSLKLAQGIRDALPLAAIVLGGPEVSFVDDALSISFMNDHPHIDALVRDEGEQIVGDLFATLADGREPVDITNVVFRSGNEVRVNSSRSVPIDLEKLLPIDFGNVSVKRTGRCGLAAVYETYRGCPYECSYCSFSGRTKGIRRYPSIRVEQELTRLFSSDIDLIHFADSVFDMSLQRAKKLLSICEKYNRKTALFCYASFQNIDDELADLYERTRIQIGVGLQSFHESVLKRVNRRFSIEKFRKTVREVSKRRINYYVDIMFGLPGDDMKLFCETINQIIEINPPFIMLFPLTVIPRTQFASETNAYGIVQYDRQSVEREVKPVSGIVYANIGLSDAFTLADLRRFDDVATTLFFSYQRFPLTFKALRNFRSRTQNNSIETDGFSVLETIGKAIRDRVGDKPVNIDNPPNVEGPVRHSILKLFAEMGASQEQQRGLEALMRVEAGIAELLERVDRKASQARKAGREQRRIPLDLDNSDNLAVCLTAPARPINVPARFDDLVSEVDLRKAGEEQGGWSGIALAPWDNWIVDLVELGRVEREICLDLMTNREVALVTLARSMGRRSNCENWIESLHRLQEAGVVDVCERSGHPRR